MPVKDPALPTGVDGQCQSSTQPYQRESRINASQVPSPTNGSRGSMPVKYPALPTGVDDQCQSSTQPYQRESRVNASQVPSHTNGSRGSMPVKYPAPTNGSRGSMPVKYPALPTGVEGQCQSSTQPYQRESRVNASQVPSPTNGSRWSMPVKYPALPTGVEGQCQSSTQLILPTGVEGQCQSSTQPYQRESRVNASQVPSPTNGSRGSMPVTWYMYLIEHASVIIDWIIATNGSQGSMPVKLLIESFGTNLTLKAGLHDETPSLQRGDADVI